MPGHASGALLVKLSQCLFGPSRRLIGPPQLSKGDNEQVTLADCLLFHEAVGLLPSLCASACAGSMQDHHLAELPLALPLLAMLV